MEKTKVILITIVILVSVSNCLGASIGISPSQRNITIERGNNGFVNFLVSGSSGDAYYITISTSQEFIVNKNVEVQESSERVYIEIFIPKDADLGDYIAPVIVCVNKRDTTSTDSIGCVGAKINIKVVEARKDYSKIFILVYILTAIAVLSRDKKRNEK